MNRNFMIFPLIIILAISGGISQQVDYLGTQISEHKSNGYSSTSNLIIDNQYMYVADGGAGIKIFDISDKTSFQLVSTYDNITWAYSLAKSGNSLVVTTTDSYIQIMDVSDPLNPMFLSEVLMLGPSALTYGVAISGTSAYIATTNGGLVVVDITNPESASISNYYMAGSTYYDVEINNTQIFLMSSGGVEIRDLTDPNTLISSLNTPQITHVQVEGNFLYTYMWSEFRIYNVTNLSGPTELDSYPLMYSFGGEVNGTTAYIGDNDDIGMKILDVSDPSTIVRIGEIDVFYGISTLHIDHEYIYLTKSEFGLEVYKKDQNGISLINSVNPPSDDFNDILLDSTSSFLYTSSKFDGLQIYYQDPGGLDHTGDWNYDGLLSDIEEYNNYLYLSQGEYAIYNGKRNGIYVVDISILSLPENVSFYNTGDTHVQGMDFYQNYIFTALDPVLVLDNTDPTSLSYVGNISISAYQVKIIDGLAYISDQLGGFHILDISDPTNPVEIGSIDSTVLDFAKYGNFIFGSANSQGVTVLDVSDPTNIVELDPIQSTGLVARCVGAYENYLFVGY